MRTQIEELLKLKQEIEQNKYIESYVKVVLTKEIIKVIQALNMLFNEIKQTKNDDSEQQYEWDDDHICKTLSVNDEEINTQFKHLRPGMVFAAIDKTGRFITSSSFVEWYRIKSDPIQNEKGKWSAIVETV